mmetsp:Transcript_2147/g.3897  ORF Transcript_2147/g.3897 Transcript_2147/m.3897 type:complete len:460 (+) Transcript_2147:284-1663(+)
MPVSMKTEIINWIRRSENTLLASIALVIYFIDIKKPFRGALFVDAYPVLESSPVSSILTSDASPSNVVPPLQYVEEVIRTRTLIMKVIRAAITSTSTGVRTQWTTMQGLQLNDSVLNYSQQHSVFYHEICLHGEIDVQLLRVCGLHPVKLAKLSQNSAAMKNNIESKIVVISAAVGQETTQYAHVISQSIPVDFILFTNSPSVIKQVSSDRHNVWEIDSTPYHLDPAVVDEVFDITALNVTSANPNILHTFYKTHFYKIPRLMAYDFVIWLEPSIVVHSEYMAENIIINSGLSSFDIAVFEFMSPLREVFATNSRAKYALLYDNSGADDVDEVSRQSAAYSSYGYTDAYWKSLRSDKPMFGHWCTDFLVYNMKHTYHLPALLSVWFQQIVEYSSAQSLQMNDAFSFSFIIQMVLMSQVNNVELSVLSLPSSDHNISGSFRMNNMFQNNARRSWKFQQTR